MDVFDATAITMSSASDWSALERAVVGAFVEPAIGAYNAYAQAVSRLRKQMRNRMLDDRVGMKRSMIDWIL